MDCIAYALVLKVQSHSEITFLQSFQWSQNRHTGTYDPEREDFAVKILVLVYLDCVTLFLF